jgi:hypothetical protein
MNMWSSFEFLTDRNSTIKSLIGLTIDKIYHFKYLVLAIK